MAGVPNMDDAPSMALQLLLSLLALPFVCLGLAILTAIYIYYLSAVPSLIWRCFVSIGRKTKQPPNR